MVRNTQKGSRGGNPTVELGRIIPKIINLLAYKKRKKGRIDGTVSLDVIQREDICYNRKNKVDIYRNKPKNVKRQDHVYQPVDVDAVQEYEINVAKRRIKMYNRLHNHSLTETCLDIVSSVNGIETAIERMESTAVGRHVHHIFPKSEFPSIASVYENLIAITSKQHLEYAHPEGRTNRISRPYQHYLLLCKIKRIREDTDGFYSFDRLINVLNTGFGTDVFSGFTENDYDQIFEQINEFYAA